MEQQGESKGERILFQLTICEHMQESYPAEFTEEEHALVAEVLPPLRARGERTVTMPQVYQIVSIWERAESLWRHECGMLI